ncbi:MAG TPA: tol-pal system protein YbgF [Hyphomicrobiaceae bacterium]|nr:tol-pal system protein YbgF [Hyphomicrobiaceae bacterium]
MTLIPHRCGPRRYGPLLAATFLLAAALGPLAFAQQAPQGPSRGPTPPSPKGPAAPARDSQPATDSALRQRVEQLEEQLVDMQVAVGTLESLARGTAAAPGGPGGGRQGVSPAGALGAADAGRLDSIETQIRALAAQLEQVQEQVRSLSARTGELSVPGGQAAVEPGPPRPGRPEVGSPQPERTQFGSVTVSPGAPRDEIDRILTSPPQAGAGPLPQMATASPGTAEPEQSPKQLYETAYGYLLQRDYGAAEAAFDEFLRRHPNDPLAGNAQYWLGESLYVRGQYRAAAGAFLKGYQTYGKSAKAPESLLKLAMSLQRLGQKDAACSSFSELTTKFPSAPSHVKTTAQTERQRAGC